MLFLSHTLKQAVQASSGTVIDPGQSCEKSADSDHWPVNQCICHKSGCPSNTLTLAPHYYCMSPTDYISHNPLHTDFTQLIALITADCTDHSLHWLHWSHTLYKPWTSSLSLPSIVLPLSRSLSIFSVCLSCWLPGLFNFIWLFAAYLFDTACLLDFLSVCRLPWPLHCPCLCTSLAYVTLVTVDWTLPVWPPLV